jgi:hypothetical protein
LNGEATSEWADAVETERRREVDGEDLVPLLDREVLDRRDELDAGVVDQDVHRAERLLGVGDHAGDLGWLGHVGGGVPGLDLEVGLDPGALGLDVLGFAEAVDGDVRPLRGQGPGDGETDPAGGPGDDGGLRGEGHDALRSV